MTDPRPLEKAFGCHVRSLRRARGYTQDELAKRSRVSPDTIRRVEAGTFSASLATIGKIAGGLRLDLATMFDSFELLGDGPERSLLSAIRCLSPSAQAIAVRIVDAIADLETTGTRRE